MSAVQDTIHGAVYVASGEEISLHLEGMDALAEFNLIPNPKVILLQR